MSMPNAFRAAAAIVLAAIWTGFALADFALGSAFLARLAALLH
jgi:hypothetical protein